MANKGSMVGHVNELKLKEDDFNGWVERFELYIQLNEVNTHKKKLLFLTLIGNEGYSLLRDLCLPVKPLDKSYDNLKTLLSEYMNPKPNVVTERFKFKEWRQGNETIIQFVAVLKKMSEFCGFGTHLEDALRDQLVWGIKDQNIQKRLLSEASLNFKRSVELSVAMEAATNDVNQLHNQNQVEVLYQEPKNELVVGSRVQRKAMSTGLRQKRTELVCYCCGEAGHVKPKCKYKDLLCKKCNKKGHLKKVCKNDSFNVNNLEQDEVGMMEMESLYNLVPLQVNFIKPYCLELIVDGKNVLFQIDTGSGISVISVDSVKKFKIGSLDKLIKTNLKLKAYNGNIINPLGILSLVIGHKGLCKTLDLYVVNEGGPPIMGRDWITAFKVLPMELGLNTLSVQSMAERFPSVFSNSLGCYKNKTFELVLKSDSKPIFCRPRIIPFSLKDKVSLELDRMIADGLLEPVESSDWATPIVPVVKVDGSIRLCGDYKVTVNKSLVVDRYPIPRVNELLSRFQGATKFCTLDLCQAYQQLPLSAESQKLTTITTHRGLFFFKRVPYGIASAPGLLQREMENILSGLTGVGCFYDDVVIAGHCVDKDGLHIPEERVKAIAQVKTPENVHQLKAFLGLVNYYGKFFRNMSSMASPLYFLLKANVKFCWGPEQNKAFINIKNHLMSKTVLTHYDTTLELVLACDASPKGIGAVLSHRFHNGEEKPIAFASRTLSKSEQGYSQLDKEALALVFGVKYFHQYLYGRPFILKTDHKPLISIFGEKKGIPVMAAHRLQRYAIFLAGYSYNIEFVKGVDNGNADALSRLPIEGADMINHVFCSNFFINLITTNVQGIADLDICEEIQRDKVLKKVFLLVMSGKWPNSSK
ncbi:unnamed protein product [Macrosiphum euphorbiae]|uniref:RNA-directed DNA polymerase n=1 Tax=Macrosiphum euphorbiae TaxID=13131 RepID=A0AAV0VR85_9HEMI|nr:unnamed protein product [Macrosiphum euphorbiae]